MSDDIVRRLREFDAELTKEILDGEHGEDGHLWVIPYQCIKEAADEIERLRAERDEARWRLCKVVGDNRGVWGCEIAKENGWDYLATEAKP